MNENVTALIPIHRTEGNRVWLEETLTSLRPQCKVMVLENEGDIAGSFNTGLREAGTEFVLPFGADDIARSDMVEWLHGAAWDADVVYPSIRQVDENLQPLGFHPAEAFCEYRLERGNFIPACSLIRREKALEVGGFRPDVWLEDWDLWVRMMRAGARFKPCPNTDFLYRRREGSRNNLTPEQVGEQHKLIVGKNRPVKATFYAQATPATTYLRCTLPGRYLPGLVRMDIAMITPDDTDDVHFPEQEGAAIFQFAGDKTKALCSRLMQLKHGIKVLVEVDDNYLFTPPKQIMRKAGWERRIGEGVHTREGHRKIVEKADGVIVTTEWLAKHYRKVNPNVYVCPNTIDPKDWPEPKGIGDDVTRVAWIASSSHVGDIPLVAPAMRWAAGQRNVTVHTVGIEPRIPGVRQHGWEHDLHAYRQRFQAFDIGLAPVKDTPYFRGRSDVKALEYGMGMVAPVLSDLSPYDNWTHGENCLKAKDAKGFKQHVRFLVEHPEERERIARAAREYALSRSTENMIHLWEEAIA